MNRRFVGLALALTLVLALPAVSSAGSISPGWGDGTTPGVRAPRSATPLSPLSQPLRGILGQASASDPTGDTFGTGVVQIDITNLSVEEMGGSVVFGFSFAGSVSPTDSGAANAVSGFIDIDADQNGATGDIPFVDFLTTAVTGMGNEFYVDLFSFDGSTGLADVVDDNADVVVGSAQVTFGASSMTVSVPQSIIGTSINAAAVLGTIDEPTDVVPNGGFVSSAGMGNAFRLNNDRFEVAVSWREFTGNTGPGRVVVRSDDSAVLYFFTEDNWEMLIKVLNGCPVNDHFWVFFAATTNVEFTVTVTDTDSGQVKQYTNPLGQAADAVTDTAAFATCP